VKPAAHQYEDKLLELAYGELPAHEASAVESHVRGCTRCTEALQEIRAVRSTMGQLPAVEPPVEGLDSLYAYAEQAARRNSAGPAPQATWWRRLIAPLAVVSAVAVVAVVGYQVQKSPEGGELPRRDQLVVEAQKKEAAAVAPVAPAAPEPAPPAVAVAPTPVAAPATEAAQADAPAELKGSLPSYGRERDPYAAPQDELAKMDAKPSERAKTKATRAAPLQKAAPKAPEKEAELGDLVETANRLDQAKSGKKDVAPPPSMMNAWPPDYQHRGADKAIAPKGEAVAATEKAEKSVDFGVHAGDSLKNKEPSQAFEAPPAPAQPVVQAAPAPKPSPAPPPQMAGPAGGGAKRGTYDFEESAQKPMAPPPPPLAVASSAPSQQQAMPRTNSMGVFADRKAQQQQLTQREEGRAADDNDGYAAAKQVSANAEDKKRQVVYELDAKLRQARAAEQAEDAKSEARLALEILSHEPRGQQRMEALAYACRALQMLGQVDEATRYCSALASEFPGNAVGRQWAENQRRERPAPAKRSKKAYDFDEERAAETQKPADPPATQIMSK
jgi:hypothetical protein